MSFFGAIGRQHASLQNDASRLIALGRAMLPSTACPHPLRFGYAELVARSTHIFIYLSIVKFDANAIPHLTLGLT